MADKKQHLDVDLGFLDKKESPKAEEPKVVWAGEVPKAAAPTPSSGSTPPSSPRVSTGYKYNWKNILIIGGIILFFGWAIFSGDSDSSSSASDSSYTPTTQASGSDDSVIVGQYSCSSYYASQADSMEPSDTTKQQLATEQSALETRSDRIDALKSSIDNSSVSEYSDQSEIDSYNYDIDSYNSQLTSYRSDASSLSDRIDAFNAQVQTYNDYLDAHCTKRY